MLDETELREGLGRILRLPPEDVPQDLVDRLIDEPDLDTAYSEAVNSNEAQATRLVVGYYQTFLGRQPDADGLTFWTNQLRDSADDEAVLTNLAASFATAPEFRSIFLDQPVENVVLTLYANNLGRDPLANGEDIAGFNFWVNVANTLIDQGLEAGLDQEQARINALSFVGEKFATSTEFRFVTADEAIDNILLGLASEEGDATLDPTQPLDIGGEAPTGGTIFTDGIDNLGGTAGDDVFTGPVVQSSAGFGNVTNTFETGDSANGGAGFDAVNADLTQVISGSVPIGPAISPNLTGIEQLNLRAQYQNVDPVNDNNVPGTFQLFGIDLIAFNAATLDAENTGSVQQYWSRNSRADIVIEDIRSAPASTFFGFQNSDPGVGYYNFFDPAALTGELNNSTLTLDLLDETNPENELQNVPVTQVTFSLNGEEVVLEIEEVPSDGENGDPVRPTTYEQFVVALGNALDVAAEDNAALENVSIADSVGPEGNLVVTLTDSAGGTFEEGTFQLDDTVPGDTDIRTLQDVGSPQLGDITTNIILDGVGRGSEGKEMVVGSMSTRGGVEIFDVQVGADSWLQELNSTNNALEQVNVSALTDNPGALNLGSGTEIAAGLNSVAREPVWEDNRLGFRLPSLTNNTGLNDGGLSDVRVFDAIGYTGAIRLSADLDDPSLFKYIDDVDMPDPFMYLFGEAGDNLWMTLDGDVTREPGFMLMIEGNGGDDRFNLWDIQDPVSVESAELELNESGAVNGAKDGISVDGGTGVNTLATNSNTGVRDDGRDAYNSVLNVQNFIIEGSNDTTQNLLDGNVDTVENVLSSVAVETGGAGPNIADTAAPGVSTEISQMRIDTPFTISGINQTLNVSANGDDDQLFNEITVDDLRPGDVPGLTTSIVNLDNEARSTGRLIVKKLQYTRTDDVPEFLNTVQINSNGRLDTANVVQDFMGEWVEDINVQGTQALSLHVSDAATARDGADLDINGSALEGNFHLAVNGELLQEGANDSLTARGDGTVTNTLAIYGSLDDLSEDDDEDAVDTTITGFQELQFGLVNSPEVLADNSDFDGTLGDVFCDVTVGAEGEFDLSNTSGLTNIVISNTSGDLLLDEVTTPVEIGDPSFPEDEAYDDDDAGAPGIAEGSTITINGADSSAVLDLTINEELGEDDPLRNCAPEVDGGYYGSPEALENGFSGSEGATLDARDYTTVNLDVERPADVEDGDLDETLLCLRIDEDANEAGGSPADAEARTLNVTGGDEDEDDRLVLSEALPATLNTVNATGYDGGFFARLDQFAGTDINFILDEQDDGVDSSFIPDAQIVLAGDRDTERSTILGFNPDLNEGEGDGEDLDDVRSATLDITATDSEGEERTQTFEVDVSEALEAGSDPEDFLILLESLVSEINTGTPTEGGEEASPGDYLAQVVFSYNGDEFTSLAAVANSDDAIEDAAAARELLAFADGEDEGEVTIGLQVTPSPESDFLDDSDGIDRIVLEGDNEDGSPIFDSGNLLRLEEEGVPNPIVQDASNDPFTYEFTDEGNYNARVTFTAFDTEANSGDGSLFQVDNFVLGFDGDDEGEAVDNPNTLTQIDITGLGVAEEDLEFGFDGDNSFGVEGDFTILLNDDFGDFVDLTDEAVRDDFLEFNLIA